MNEKVGVSQDNPDPFPAPEYVHLYERPEKGRADPAQPAAEQRAGSGQIIVASSEFLGLLKEARSRITEGWRVVPGSVQCLTEWWKPQSSERVETLSRFVLLMERPEEDVQVVDMESDK